MDGPEGDGPEAPGAPDEEELLAWLALARLPGVGPRALARLVPAAGGARALLEAAPGLPPPWRARLSLPDRGAAEAELAWARRRGGRVLVPPDPDYPPLLREIPDPPPVLHVQGEVRCLRERPWVALVGSRRPGPGGRRTARTLGEGLARAGVGVASGLALGIDGEAHRGALAGGGPTAAVLGSGLARIHPASHRELAARVRERGVLLSELPPEAPPRPGHFPRRNRIIAGLSLATVVVEAARRSGSLITARLALEQGREVGAVPGPVASPTARGCHRLLKEGAAVVEEVEDVLALLGPHRPYLTSGEPRGASGPLSRGGDPEGEPAGLPEPARRVLEALGFEPAAADIVVERTGLTADEVSSMLAILELHGLVEPVPGGLYHRVS